METLIIRNLQWQYCIKEQRTSFIMIMESTYQQTMKTLNVYETKLQKTEE